MRRLWIPRFWWLRVAALLAVTGLVISHHGEFPSGYEPVAWALVAAFALQTAVILAGGLRARNPVAFDVAVIATDALLVFGAMIVFDFQRDQPFRALVFVLVAEAALRFGTRGGLAVAAAGGVLLAGAEIWSGIRFGSSFEEEAVVVRFLIGITVGFLVGGLTDKLVEQRAVAESRASEAERLRDELGRRVDLLEAANRCARALGSSLELEQAFTAFIRELRGLVPFDRMAIVLAESGTAQVMAAAGAGVETVFPPGSTRPVEGSVLEEVLQGQLVYREDMGDRRHEEEDELLEIGLRCRLVAPLLLGPKAIGMLSVVRADPRAFTPEEMEFVSLLGRLVATGVQNIRAYEAERRTVEELRRLSALRADFVSLVSHELRSPMAAVIGSARTLQQRWRELTPEQRESFLELIAGETNRLAALVADVLDTSRIEAGTFTYSFSDVDVGELVHDTVSTAAVGQDEVQLAAAVQGPLPQVRADRERLRQVLTNLVDNAVKYSPAGSEVRVQAYRHGDRILIDVTDAGPGIPREQQGLIFEKFGRAKSDGGKPGTGLGLFIARSIAEAHGGTLDVQSAERRGATFTLSLPVLKR